MASTTCFNRPPQSTGLVPSLQTLGESSGVAPPPWLKLPGDVGGDGGGDASQAPKKFDKPATAVDASDLIASLRAANGDGPKTLVVPSAAAGARN